MSTKLKVLEIFRSKGPEYVSGQELADTLGLSRNSVWKAIRKLQAEGFDIESKASVGYRLLQQEEDLLFEVRTRDAVSLSISIDETTLNATPVKKLHVFTYSPSFSISATAADETIPVTIETAYTNAVGQAAIEVTSGLSVGSRMVFAFVEDEDGKCYAARPQRIVLRPGSNHLQNLKLINEATTP